MDVNDIQNSLTLDQVAYILQSLDGDPIIEDDSIVARTICHGGDSHKLYYYDNSKRFTCYTGDCGYGFSIFDLIQKALGVDFLGSKNYLISLLNINTDEFKYSDNRLDLRLFDKFDKMLEIPEEKEVKYYNPKVLNHFYRLYHKSWIDDNITVTSMEKFGIMFNVAENQIIIPHKDITGGLIGIRVRNLFRDVVERGMKYMPLRLNKDIQFNHNTGDNLYGVYENKDDIIKSGKIILFESEKSVMQLNGYWDNNIGVALSGHNLSDKQVDIIHSLGINEVIIALDKEYEDVSSEQAEMYAKNIRSKIVEKLNPFYTVSIIWDRDNLLEYKDSPTDKGSEVWNELFKNRIIGGK